MKLILMPMLLLLFFVNCTGKTDSVQQEQLFSELPDSIKTNLKTVVLAGGCFWCVEGVFESVKGVYEVVSGYSGGKTNFPTYEQIGTGKTGHAEAVQVYYDPKVVSFISLVNVFFASIDPTQVNGQGPDHGTQYRSIVFYETEEEKISVEKFIHDLKSSEKYSRPIAVEVMKLEKFWVAENYHQDFVRLNPTHRYVVYESIPRIIRTQKLVSELIDPKKIMK